MLKEKKDYSEDWKRYNEELNRPAREAALYRWKRVHGHIIGRSSPRRDDDSGSGGEVVVVEKPVYIEREVVRESTPSYQQPNLSGFYYSVPMSGPNVGRMELRYVGGPY